MVGCHGCGPDMECSFLICSEFLVLGEICLFLLVSLFLTMLLLGSSFPDQGVHMRQLKILPAAIKTWHSQRNTYIHTSIYGKKERERRFWEEQ